MHTLAHSGSLPAPGLWQLSLHPAALGHFMLAAIALGAIAVGFLSSIVATRFHIRFVNLRELALANEEHFTAALRFRDALLAGTGNAVLVLESAGENALSIGGANVLLQACMDGPDAKRVAAAVDDLMRNGLHFQIFARTAPAAMASLCGTNIGNRAVIFARDLGTAAPEFDYRSALEALPAPVWLRSQDLVLKWANRAFLDAVGIEKLADATSLNASIERSELELAAAARDSASAVAARRYAMAGGKRRAFDLNLAVLADGALAGMAMDVTGETQAEAKLQLNADAVADMLDGLPVAVAVFGADRRLASYNAAYASLWGFAGDWLDTHPVLSEILDRLRETRQLPEQSDFAAWKREQLGHLELTSGAIAQYWHCPGGRSVRATVRPHLMGGVFYTFEDKTEQLQLEASFKLLNQVQRATLDTVDDAMAIFAPDGRLVLHNRNFAKMWKLAEEELAGQPLIGRIASLVEQRLGRDAIWSIVAVGLASNEPERCSEWGKTARADGRIISLSMARLPNGATAATFVDVTDFENFAALDKEDKRSDAAA